MGNLCKNLMMLLHSRLTLTALIFAGILGMGMACNKKETSGEGGYNPTPMVFVKPINLPEPTYNFTTEQPTKEGFALGRKLFYDERLSDDNTISCGSCHKASAAFADPGVALSPGVRKQVGIRNSTTIMNVAWNADFFWDGRATHLNEQPISPIHNPLEMNESIANVVKKIKDDATYKSMFYKAFGTDVVDSSKILKSLGMFMAFANSYNSKFDRVQRNENGEKFTVTEQEGYVVFIKKCDPCHKGHLFTDNKFHINGLPPTEAKDSGRFVITRNINDLYLFKTPSLRNILYTAPYMHDGRFNTLDEVFNHYTKNAGLEVTNADRTRLRAFLSTLTDSTFLNNKDFADPGN